MGINKVVNHVSKSHGGLKNVLEYSLRDEKVKDGYVEVLGPYDAESVNYEDIYKSWLTEKRLWNKDGGRLYSHNIVSFHKNENITPEQVLRIGILFARKFFFGYQSVIAVHQDKGHLHCHIITNSVSYLNGRKLHQTKHDLQEQKNYTNEICRKNGLSVAEKGKHFDGTEIETETIRSWNKDTYKLLADGDKKSYLVDLMMAIDETKRKSYNREEFILGMKEAGWDVTWTDSRKNLTFINQTTGKRVRDTNLSKTFTTEISKEVLERDFNRKTERRQQLQSAANARGFAAAVGRGAGQDKTPRVSHQRL